MKGLVKDELEVEPPPTEVMNGLICIGERSEAEKPLVVDDGEEVKGGEKTDLNVDHEDEEGLECEVAG